MQLSTRNRLPGTITEVVKGEAAAKVTLQVGDNHLVALITRESADELGLEAGKAGNRARQGDGRHDPDRRRRLA